MLDIKAKIEEKYGTVNKFLDENHHKLSISRTHFYKLISNDDDVNPTLKTMLEISDILELNENDVIKVYVKKIRNAQSKAEE